MSSVFADFLAIFMIGFFHAVLAFRAIAMIVVVSVRFWCGCKNKRPAECKCGKRITQLQISHP